MKRERGILISVVTAALVMVFLCIFFTSDRAVSVKKLKKCVPDAVHFEEDGREQYDFLMEAYDEAPGSIVFYTAHQSVAVYADGEELYTLETSDSIWGETPGWRWCFVVLPDGVSRVCVQLTPCYQMAAHQEQIFYIGGGNDIYMGLLQQSMFAFLISMIILLVGIYITLYWIVINKGKQVDGTLLYLGIFSILLGLWSANETNMSALIFVNRQAGSYLAFVTLMVMPMAFLLFVKSFLEIHDNRCWKIIFAMNFAVIILDHILNMTGLYEFRQSLWITHLIILLVIVYVLVAIINKMVKRQLDQKLKYCVGMLILVFLAAIIDLIGYYRTGNNAGVFGRIAFLIFILLFGIMTARQTVASLKKVRRAEELEQFALNDTMTGMYNRNAYDYYVRNEKQFAGYLIVTFDLNNLKQCNDLYGHRAGDAYLVNAARMIEDNFDRYGKCYRIGGDEFCCIIPEGSDCKIQSVLRKLHQDAEILNNKNIVPVEVGIACGCAVATAEDTDLEKVRERADEEMYQKKREMKAVY